MWRAIMLTKAQIDALLAEKYSTRVANDSERLLLKNYLAQQTGEEINNIFAQFDAIHIQVTDECAQSISFTWSLRQHNQYELHDSFFCVVPKVK